MSSEAAATAKPKGWLSPQKSEWPVLAAVRFIMALMVVTYHLPIVRPTAHIPFLEDFGGLGCICGFLAISGYSISHSIQTQPKGFFGRRAWRIMPTYYATLALSIVPYLFAKHWPPFRYPFEDPKTSEVVGSLFFAQCFLTEKIAIFGPSWTLAVEWWFYMLAPLFARARMWMLAVLVVLAYVAQSWGMRHGYYPVSGLHSGMPAVMLLWAWLSGFLYHRARGWTAILVVLVGYYAVSLFPDRSPAAYWIAAFALVTAQSYPPMPRALARVLNWLGDLSYPLYLVHVPLMAWTARWTTWTDPYAFVGISLAASVVLYHGLDQPLRSRFSSRGVSTMATQPARA